MTEKERTGFLTYLAAIIDVHKNMVEQDNALINIDAELRKPNDQIDELKSAIRSEEAYIANVKSESGKLNSIEAGNTFEGFKGVDSFTKNEIIGKSLKYSAIISVIVFVIAGAELSPVLVHALHIKDAAGIGISFVLGLIVFAICMFVAIKIQVANAVDDIKERNKQSKEDKTEQLQKYDKQIANSEQDLNSYRNQLVIAETQDKAKKEYLKGLQETLTRVKASSCETYKKLLEPDALPGKFKQIEYVVLVYDLLDTRQTNELEGPTGAFRMASTDARLDTIINKLDTVINSLGDISGVLTGIRGELIKLNQTVSLIGSDISRINYSISEMNLNIAEIAQNADAMTQNAIHVSTQLDNLEAKASLLAYQQERTAREIEFANKLQYIKDGQYSRYLFDNRPPHMR